MQGESLTNGGNVYIAFTSSFYGINVGSIYVLIYSFIYLYFRLSIHPSIHHL